MNHWSQDAFFYHIYPLGFCGAPQRNDFSSPPVERLAKISAWLDHIQSLGANALNLGPVFESSAHGYDTTDYYQVDRRLGTRQTLADLTAELHRRGMRVILDGVFNHTGRDFWAFKDVQTYREGSTYRDWFSGLRFDRASPYRDPFAYDGWNGNYDLVKLNLHHPHLRAHLLDAVRGWIRDFAIDGLRLDAVDCVDHAFLRELSATCRELRSDFWLMGEAVLGDYREWVRPQELDSATNYEAYKGLYSSHNDRNYFEIAYTLNRQFGPDGIYAAMPLYSFADNHDVNRVASTLKDPAHLYPLYALLFTMPGVPSIYYGSEFGLLGVKDRTDAALRPALDLGALQSSAPHPHLARAIRRLAELRRRLPALRDGDYHQLTVGAETLAFTRQSGDERVLVAVNAASQPANFDLKFPFDGTATLSDELNHEGTIAAPNGAACFCVPPYWARVFRVV